MITTICILFAIALGASLYAFNAGRKLKKTRAVLFPLEDISTDLVGSAEQIQTVSRDLKKASEDQMDTLNSTVSCSNEISSMMMRTQDHTLQLDNEAQNLSKMAVAGNNIVQEMVSTSLEIKKGSETFKHEMEKNLNELYGTLHLIKNISEKTKLINDIVFQTKLLSFNASVEAARAGEAGKGFSVVAEEIGKLAKMSGHTADEIARIVEQSTRSIDEALAKTKTRTEELMNESLEKNELGYNSTKHCEQVFGEIADKINYISSTIKEIALATKEQSIGVQELDVAILKLQEMADRNNLVASQSTEQAHEFEKQTANLIKMHQELVDLKINNRDGVKFQKFVWNDKLELGVRQMDDEHKVLIDRINAFITALEQQYIQKDKQMLLNSFNALASYTVEHFEHEERYMQSVDYPQYNSHKKIHENLLNQVGIYGEQIKNGTLNEKKIVSFLRNWLLSHIMGVDMQYSKHAHDKHHHHHKSLKRTA